MLYLTSPPPPGDCHPHPTPPAKGFLHLSVSHSWQLSSRFQDSLNHSSLLTDEDSIKTDQFDQTLQASENVF